MTLSETQMNFWIAILLMYYIPYWLPLLWGITVFFVDSEEYPGYNKYSSYFFIGLGLVKLYLV